MGDLKLRVGNLVARAEELDVGFPNHGHNGYVRRHQVTQEVELPGPVHPHLDDQHLGIGFHRQDRHGHPNLVVKVRVGLGHVELRRQDGRNHVLGGRLTVTPGHGNHAWVDLREVVAGQRL